MVLLLWRNLVKEKEGAWRRRIYRKYASWRWLKDAGLEFTRAEVVESISRDPPGQWFPETEYWASAIFVGTSGIPPKIIYRSVKSYKLNSQATPPRWSTVLATLWSDVFQRNPGRCLSFFTVRFWRVSPIGYARLFLTPGRLLSEASEIYMCLCVCVSVCSCVCVCVCVSLEKCYWCHLT